MEFKKITRLTVFLCLFSAVLSVNVQHGKNSRFKKSAEMEEALMHPKRMYKRASTPQRDADKGPRVEDGDTGIGEISQFLDEGFMRRIELDDSEMHDPPNIKKSLRPQNGYDLDGMHRRPPSTLRKDSSPKGGNDENVDDDIGEISQFLDEGLMRRIELDDSEMHDQPNIKKSSRPQNADDLNGMHPRAIPQKESLPKGGNAESGNADISQILDEEFMQRMELDDSEMHDPSNTKKSSRPQRGIDVADMNPKPGVHGVQTEDEIVEDPAIRDSDLFSLMGKDIFQQIAFDDSVMHQGKTADQKFHPSSKSERPPEEMGQRIMHPHGATRKDNPAKAPSKEDVSTELDEDFLRQMELDDSRVHSVDDRIGWEKSSYYKGKDKKASLRIHPEMALQNHDVDDQDAGDEIDVDDLLGRDFMKRMEFDDSYLHDSNPHLREDVAGRLVEERSRSGISRRLLSLQEDEIMPQMAMKNEGKLSQIKARLGFPIHASCRLSWMFGVNCSTVSMDLVNQIKKWSGSDNCDQGGEKCLYSLVSVNSTILLAKHETPKQHYVDDLSFKFTQKGANCAVHGYSTSETWYAVLDKGTNYCNLHNLITGSGLDETKGYKENTNDGECTQYSSSDCDVY
ncbi:uncharacterized protein LOC121428037 [Lytechinus variegatus]|uniref:uncharacterized protein LOC121428037 n=1 Tax=Lytechinus variegatus TaxID=7654 RepID=UPI001BB103C1|nr:uncharacterized protein LOC121428037 [Lytechinus variegatus]